jgi:hypothetical protein
MIEIYTAPNTIEAHMVLDLLEQAGIKGLIKNEQLQGLERLDSGGFVGIYVDEDNVNNATKIIADMESQQPKQEVPRTPIEKTNPFKYIFIGFMAGSMAVALYFYTPYVVQKFDNNHDGKADGKYVSFGNRLSKCTYDRNFDGKVDLIYKYKWENELNSAESDDNFDGIFETFLKFSNGNISWSESDTTGDGFKDYRNEYKNGILNKAIFYDPKTKKPVKVQHYEGQKLVSAQIDTNGDGILNQTIEYNAIEEAIKKTNLTY